MTQNGVTTTTVYVGNLQQVVTTGGATTWTNYYNAGSARIAVAVNGIFSYLGSDGLGSASVALNTSGSATASTLYAPYGGVRYGSGTMPTDYGFTGQHSDSVTGLDYYNARYYDPVAGQFTTADTILQGDGYDILGLSRYAYVEGNPTGHTDPSGHALCLVAQSLFSSSASCGGSDDPTPPPDDTSSPTGSNGTPAEPSGPCLSLNCSLQDFQNMSAAERQTFVSTFQSYWGSRYDFQGWFNNIEAVLRFLNDNKLIGSNNWFGLVDATILKSISDGLALSLNRINKSELSSATDWSAFFSYRLSLGGNKETDQTAGQSTRLWGRAELAATAEGTRLGSRHNLEPTRAEAYFTLEGDAFYRGPLANWGGPWDPRNGQQAHGLVEWAWGFASALTRPLMLDRMGAPF